MMQQFMIPRRGARANQEELEKTAALSGQVGNEEMADKLRWIRSDVINEPDRRPGTCCTDKAVDGEAISEHARRVGMPGDDYFATATTILVRPYPEMS